MTGGAKIAVYPAPEPVWTWNFCVHIVSGAGLNEWFCCFMAIINPADLIGKLPKTPLEAAPYIARQWACQAGRAINYWGHITQVGALTNFARRFPLNCPSFIPLPPETNPPVYLPNTGGQCPVIYRVAVEGRWKRGDGFEETQRFGPGTFPGPISPLYIFTQVSGGTTSYSVRFNYGPQNTLVECFSANSSAPPNDLIYLYQKFTILQRVDGLPDNCGDPPPVIVVPPPLPPDVRPLPDPPQLPGGSGNQPVKPTKDPPDAPPYYLPWVIPPIVIPVTPIIAPNFNVPISVPINIPISFPLSFNPTINANITVQIDPDGNIRTPPDLICPCETTPEPPGGGALDTTQFRIPYYECGSSPGFKSETITAVSSSIPAGLFDKLLSSSNLAEVGCEVVSKVPVAPTQLAGGTVNGVVGIVSYYPLVDEDIKVVRLKIFPQRVDDFRETTIFQGTGQRLFAVMSWALDGGQGGNAVECWDMVTDMALPFSAKQRVIKMLLKPGLRWELWDTGDR